MNNGNAQRLENLRRNITLAESKKKVCYEEGEAEKAKNAEYVNQLKEEIEALKSRQSKTTEQSNLNVLTDVIQHRSKSHVIHKKNKQELVELLDQWMYDITKQQNAYVYVKNKNCEQILKLKAKRDELVRQITSQFQPPSDIPGVYKKLQELENDHEKLAMKIEEAELLQKKYSSIKLVLQDDLLNLRKDMHRLEVEIDKSKAEIPQLQLIARNAVASSKDMEAELMLQDKTFSKQKWVWEKALMAYQHQIQETQMSQEEDNTISTPERTASESKNWHAISSKTQSPNGCLEVCLEAKEKNSDSEDLSQVSDEHDRRKLKDIIKKFERKVKKLEEEKTRLEQNLLEARFSLDNNTNNSLESLQQQVNSARTEKDVAILTSKNYNKLISELHEALHQLCIKIADACKINCGMTLSPSPDDVLELLMTCSERIEILVDHCRDYDRQSATKMYEGVKYNENVEEAQSALKSKKKTQPFEDQFLLSARPSEEQDTAVDQEFPTRAMIKRQCKILLDRHAKTHQKGPRN